MSAIQEIAPYISAYQGNIKRAKEDQHYTIDRLVDESGVSRSAVTKLCAGTQQDPKLYNYAAFSGCRWMNCLGSSSPQKARKNWPSRFIMSRLKTPSWRQQQQRRAHR